MYSRDIKEYDVKKYHDTIGTVFQDFQIFAGSVKENVLLDVADGIDDEGIKKALTQSGLMERINKFEKGLDTELTTEFSQEGVNLSGGESQKLAISRVFYKDAGLMILDEPSSALGKKEVDNHPATISDKATLSDIRLFQQHL